MSDTWRTKVATYVDQLEEIAKSIDSILEQTQIDTLQVKCEQVDQSTSQLQQALIRLEEKIAQREGLLKAPDAPQQGLSLTEKLKGTRHIDDARLARRCEQLAALIASTNDRAIALFVCQYHLADCSSEIVRLISGNTAPATYDPSRRTPTRTSGGLFNESA
jgi:hypothetical protein